jgi:uncharacterized protein YodC (DUF2158 family)
MTPERFSAGDVVRLKTGKGVTMSVVGVTDAGVECTYRDVKTGRTKKQTFSHVLLQKGDKSGRKPAAKKKPNFTGKDYPFAK